MPALDALLLLAALTPFASALAAPQAQPQLSESQQQNATSAISTAVPSPVLAHTATAWLPEDASTDIPTSTPSSITTITYGPTTSPTGQISTVPQTAVVEVTDSSFDVPTSTLVVPGQQASDKPGKGGDRPAYGPPTEDDGERGDQDEEMEPAGTHQQSATESHKGGDRPAYGSSDSDESTDDDSSGDGDDASSETGGDDQDSASSDDGSERPAYGPPTTSTPPPPSGSDEPSSTYISHLTLATSVSGAMTAFAPVTAISQSSFDTPVWTTALPTAGVTGSDGVVTSIETTLVAMPTAHLAQSGEGEGLGRPNYAPVDGEEDGGASTTGSNSTTTPTSTPASSSPSGAAVASANGTDASSPTMSTGTGSYASVTPFPSANGTVTTSGGSMGTGSMTMTTSTSSVDSNSAEPSLNEAAQTQTQSVDGGAGVVAVGNGVGFGAVVVGLLGMLV